MISKPLLPQMVQALYGLGVDMTVDCCIQRAVRSKPVPVRQQLMPVRLMLLRPVIIFLHITPREFGSFTIRVTFVWLLHGT